jgi:serine/threonine-protein kinase
LFAVIGVSEEVSPPGRLPWIERVPHRVSTSVIALAVVLGLAGLYVVIEDRGQSFTPPEAIAEAAPGIAVLPFNVQSPDLEIWREGVVDVLSVNLDGAVGLRAIDSRTVLARWRDTVEGKLIPDTPTALEIANRTGARYAIMGSVVSSGEEMRIVAELYDVQSGRPLTQGQVDGAVDSVFALVDRLSLDLLRAIVQEGESLPTLDLASVTTTSLPALRAYLEGEVDLRQGDFRLAVDAYERAVEADSTFALAWMRLSMARAWAPGGGPLFEEAADREAADRAARYADRLPERDALLVRGWLGSPGGLEPLREATRKYPDDAVAWYMLGESAFHQGGSLLLDPEEDTRAFETAIALDSTFAPVYLHVIGNALRTEPDSARVAELVNRYEQLAPRTPTALEFRIAEAIAFGDEATQASTIAALDTVSAEVSPAFIAHANLSHPHFLDEGTEVLRASRNRPSQYEARAGARSLVLNLISRGQLSAALEASEHSLVGEDRRSGLLYLAHAAGYPLPIERLGQVLESAPGDDAGVRERFSCGAWALERSRPEVFRESLTALRSVAERSLAEGDSVAARQAEGAAEGLGGFLAWREGRAPEASELLDSARLKTAGGFTPSSVNRVVRWWEAKRALEAGQLERAARFFLSLSHGEAFASDPLATLELGRVQEKLGRYDKARENYELLVLAWQDADPELQPMVEEARQAIIRLQGLQRQ